MKKFLLSIFILGAFAAGVDAQTSLAPTKYNNTMLSTMSANGRYAAGENLFMGTIEVLDLQTGLIEEFYDVTGQAEYTLGIGANSVSDNGVFVMAPDYYGLPGYIDIADGLMHRLPAPEGITSGVANCISPDGSRIFGTIGLPMQMDASEVLQRPVIWKRLGDGSYGMPEELPYPEKDLTGRMNQYILVCGISTDGKHIAAQAVDYSGFLFSQMLLYSEDADGKWSYRPIGNELFNPKKVAIPEYPGEQPSPVLFMTPEEIDEYNAAVELSKTAVQPSPTEFMSEVMREKYQKDAATGIVYYQDYMTKDEIKAYEAAMAEYYRIASPSVGDYMTLAEYTAYQDAVGDWEVLYDEFDQAVNNILGDNVCFEMNAFTLSPNGRYLAVAGYEPGLAVMSTYLFDTTDGSYTVKRNSYGVIIPCFVSNDGTLLATKPATNEDYEAIAYVSRFNGPVTELHNHMAEANAEVHEWMTSNMLHTAWIWDDDLCEDVEQQKWSLGQPCANADMSIITTSAINFWDADNYDTFAESYVLPVNYSSGVIDIAGERNSLDASMQPDGSILVAGGATLLEIYDLNGKLLRSVANPGAVVNPGLAKGAYLIRVSDGSRTAAFKAIR